MAQGDVTRIASNIGALNALNSLVNINKQLALHQGRISTGKRINSAADDPAGLTIATKMLARSEGLKTALNNISDASNLLSVAEAGLSKMNDILVMMRSKAQQASSETLGGTERTAIQTQLESYAEQIDNIVNETKWNDTLLLAGNVSKKFQTGADALDTTTWTLSTAHDPTSLNLSTKQTNIGIAYESKSGTGTSFGSNTVPTSETVFSGLTELSTGSYTLTNIGQATSLTQSKSAVASGSSLFTGITGFVQTDDLSTSTAEISSGVYKFAITNVDLTSGAEKANWTLTDSQNNLVGSGTGTSIKDGTLTLVDANDVKLGIKMQVDLKSIAAGNMSVDYLAQNTIKYNMKDSSGVVMTIDQDGVTGGTLSTYGYAKGGAAIHPGNAITLTAGALSAANVGDTTTFSYQRTGNYTVNVSSVSLASQYMGKVDTAMNTINTSMTSLGSLMARLQFKEDQVSTAQVNVEASYSRIMNANMAEEQVNASKYSILQQTATAMLAQANTAPQNLLTLFR